MFKDKHFVNCFQQLVHSGDLGCHLDRHENIGRGRLGLDTFSRVMNDRTLDNMPLILETPPHLTDKEEIQILYSLVKSDTEG